MHHELRVEQNRFVFFHLAVTLFGCIHVCIAFNCTGSLSVDLLLQCMWISLKGVKKAQTSSALTLNLHHGFVETCPIILRSLGEQNQSLQHSVSVREPNPCTTYTDYNGHSNKSQKRHVLSLLSMRLLYKRINVFDQMG